MPRESRTADDLVLNSAAWTADRKAGQRDEKRAALTVGHSVAKWAVRSVGTWECRWAEHWAYPTAVWSESEKVGERVLRTVGT